MYYHYYNGNFSFCCELKFSSFQEEIFIKQDNESKTPPFPTGQKTISIYTCRLSAVSTATVTLNLGS